MRIEQLLKDQPILVVDGRNHLFICDLEDALTAAGADVLLARDVAKAVAYVKRFDFAACLLGVLPPEDHQRLVEALGGTPLLQLEDEFVPAIVAKLTRMLRDDRGRSLG
jgi:hypothetical protein